MSTLTDKDSVKVHWDGAKIAPSLFAIITGVILWQFHPPEGLTPQAWHLLIIFVLTIISIILKPLPIGALAITALSFCVITKTVPIAGALSSYSSKTVWLVVCAFLLARGFIITGLGSRISYYFISFLGKSTLGLSYGLSMSELILAPFIPSNTARGAGIVYPIVTSLCKEFKSNPHDGTGRQIGAYLIKVCFHVNIIVSAMFLTAMAANPLIASFATQANVELNWVTWAKCAVVPGLVNIILLPLLLYYIYPPEIKSTPDAPDMARKQLDLMGPVKFKEYVMLFTFILLLTLWVLGTYLQISATTAALCGLSILLITGVLSWDDIVNEKNAWNTFIWLATLLMMANYLTKYGMIDWLASNMQSAIVFDHWILALVLLAICYFYIHYFFASMTAHVSSCYSAFLVIALAAGAPPLLSAMLFAVFSALSASITHYGTGTAPVYFGTGYLSVSKWWQLGGIVSIFNISIWLLVGGAWWKFIGLW